MPHPLDSTDWICTSPDIPASTMVMPERDSDLDLYFVAAAMGAIVQSRPSTDSGSRQECTYAATADIQAIHHDYCSAACGRHHH